MSVLLKIYTPKFSSEDDFFLNEIRTPEAKIAMAINDNVLIVYRFILCK